MAGELKWLLELSQLVGGLRQTTYLLGVSVSLLCKMSDFSQAMLKGGQILKFCGYQSGPEDHQELE